jgi:Uma2 family endonuclease
MMSTINRPESVAAPPLVAGQRLDQATFHERYEQMPSGTRAELIGGFVYMPSPLSPDHGDLTLPAVLWLGHYERFTPGVRGTVNTSTALDDRGEPQPDLSLRILPEFGGQTRTDPRFIVGAPELVIEIARSSRAIDLGPKREDYERAGAREYLVIALDPDEIHWHIRRGDRFEMLQPGPDGWFRSEVFPGLWLNPVALFRRDLSALTAALDQGLASPEHQAFVEHLARNQAGPS